MCTVQMSISRRWHWHTHHVGTLPSNVEKGWVLLSWTLGPFWVGCHCYFRGHEMPVELPASHFLKEFLGKALALWPGILEGTQSRILSFWTRSFDPASIAHLLGDLGQLAQHFGARFFHLSNESNTYLKVSRCWGMLKVLKISKYKWVRLLAEDILNVIYFFILLGGRD